jgi:hypothetical protein
LLLIGCRKIDLSEGNTILINFNKIKTITA